MRSILDIGKSGRDQAPMLPASPGAEATLDQADLNLRLSIIKRMPATIIQAESADGVRKNVQVRTLLLNNPKVFDLVHGLAVYEPMVYAQCGGRTSLGMLSANFAAEDNLATAAPQRQSSIKVIPLQTPYPLTNRLLPDARMATMLAGAVATERRGAGSHRGDIAADIEHSLGVLGAVSLGDVRVAASHSNHAVRQASAVTTGLTNGKLGNIFAPGAAVSEFGGFGEPIIIRKDHAAPSDIVFYPDSFLDSETSFGLHYADASHLLYGAGLQALYHRGGTGLSAQIRQFSSAL